MKKNVRYKNEYQNKGHECKNLVIRCMDFRFTPYIKGLLDQMYADEGGFESYDSPGVGAGASKAIIDQGSRPVVFSSIDIAVQKHQAKRVVVIDHIDCGAYGGSSQFESPEKEEEFHIIKLKEAGEILKDKYPELEVVLLYQDWDMLTLIK